MPVSRIAQVVRDLPPNQDPHVVVGLEGSSDAGVYRLGDDLLIVQSLDFFPPLVDDPFVYGKIAATNSLSDLYAMGADPRTALNIVGFPDDQVDLEVLHAILAGGSSTVQTAGAALIGGHTVRDAEIKYGLSVTGTVSPARLLTNGGAKVGDVLILTKALGTGYVTTANRAGKCEAATLEAAITSMTQLNAIGRDVAHASGGQAATDITGFGLAVHALEMALSSRVTIELLIDAIPCLPGVNELVEGGFETRASRTNREYALAHASLQCDRSTNRFQLAFDAQTSGGLLLSLPAERANEAVEMARQLGALATCVVGSVKAKQEVDLIFA